MLQLNWKAAATVATGATALAGWLVTPHVPARSAARAPTPASTPVMVSLEQEASKLAARNRAATAFEQPQRNLFTFQSVAPAARAAVAREAAASVPAAPAAPVFPFRLTGIASDIANGVVVRTAVLSSTALGLVLAKAGDVVAESYRIDRVEDDGVDVVDVRDGRAIRLSRP